MSSSPDTPFITLQPRSKAQGVIDLPGSKSLSNRFLLLAALAEGTTHLKDLLEAADTAVMLDCLDRLGVRVEKSGKECVVHGSGGKFPNAKADLFLGNAGTAIRPLTAALALLGGDYVITGEPRMHERPIGDLVDALRAMGANIEYLGNEGFPPLKISHGNISITERVPVNGSKSSQFVSAMLLCLPLATTPEGEAKVKIVGDLISKPYVEMTLNVMQRFGVKALRHGWESFDVPNSSYKSPGTIYIEGDASSASYFLAAGAIAGGPVKVQGVGNHSIQGDVRMVETLQQMGATIRMGDNWIECQGNGKLRAIDADLNHIPDAAMTVAMCALFADGTSTLRNIGSWNDKECLRLDAMSAELTKLGAKTIKGPDYLVITPPEQWQSASIDTYDDHRMAMCFSLASFGPMPVRINDPDCVRKTFPNYFEVFASIAP